MYDAPRTDARPDHTYDAPPPDTSVKVAHLVFALLFLGAAGIWALVETDVITAERLTVLAPALLIAAGVVGLAASLASSRNRRRRQTSQIGSGQNGSGQSGSGQSGSGPVAHDATTTHADGTFEDTDDTEPTRELR